MEEQIRPILESFEEVKDLPGMRDKIPRNNAQLHDSGRPGGEHLPFHHRGRQAGPPVAGRRAPGAADVFQEADHERDGIEASRARKILARATTGPVTITTANGSVTAKQDFTV